MNRCQSWGAGKSLLCAVLWAAAMLLPACGGDGDDGGAAPATETAAQCEDRCTASSCAGTSGNNRLLCGMSCVNSCRR